MTPVHQNSSFDQIQTAISDRMKQAKLHQLVIDDFLLKTKKVYHGETGQIDFGQILNLNSDDIIDLNSLDEVSINDIKPLLEQTVIINVIHNRDWLDNMYKVNFQRYDICNQG